MTKKHLRFLVMAVVLLMVLLVPMVAAAAPVDQPPIPHPVAGRENCTMSGCHAVGAAGSLGMPAGHAAFTNAQCTGCHQAGTAGATATPTATATATATATTTPTTGGTATPTATAGGEQLPETGLPLPLMIPAIVAGASLVAGVGVKLLKK